MNEEIRQIKIQISKLITKENEESLLRIIAMLNQLAK